MATIYYRKDRKRWILQTTINGERKQVGSFKTKPKAEQARDWLNSNIENAKTDYIEVDEPRIRQFITKAVAKVAKWRKK